MDDDSYGPDDRHPVGRAGAHVGLTRETIHPCAEQQAAQKLGFLLRRHHVDHHESVTSHG
jgi:hypothetical protein